MIDWASVAADVADGLTEVGGLAAIRRTTTSGDPFDPETTTTDYPCTIFMSEFTLRERESTLIGTTDKRVLISTEGLAIEPTNADKLVVDGVAHAIVRVKPYQFAPGAAAVMWQAQVMF